MYDDHTIEVSCLDDRMVRCSIFINQMAWGDFDHDGIEDIMLQLTYHPGGSAIYDRLAFLTRLGPDEQLCIIEPFLDAPEGGGMEGGHKGQ